MEENMRSPDEIISIAFFNKKRKFQPELLEMPFPKHVCFDQALESDSSSNSTTNQKRIDNIVNQENESDQESSKDSNSFHDNEDSIMFTYNEDIKTRDYSTSSASSGNGVYSLESRLLKKSSLSKCESSYEEHDSVEFEGYADCSYSENEIDGDDKELYDLLRESGVDPNNYVLPAGKWSDDQDTQQVTNKLTIDKEFEQYFSMLML